MKLPAKTNRQKGQALLLVLLTMAVVLTVVLSVSSRSVTEVAVSSSEEDSLRAFSAAEAGVEQALLNPVVGTIVQTNPNPSDPQTFYSGSVTVPDISTDQFVYPTDLKSGQSATFWFVSHGTGSNLTCTGNPCLAANKVEFCWGNAGAAEHPAIEVMFYYDSVYPPLSVSSNNFTNVRVFKRAYDAYSRGNFTSAGVDSNCPVAGNFAHHVKINGGPELPPCTSSYVGCLLMAKVRMYYNSTTPQPVAMSVNPNAGTALPAQGFTISSTGTSNLANRKVNVFQTYANPPDLLDAAIFSMKDIVK